MLRIFSASIRNVCFLQAGGGEDLARDHVGVGVGGGAAVLKVALLLALRVAGDANGRAAVRHAVRKLVDAGGLVAAREAALIALAIRGNVLLVLGAQFLNGGDNGGVAALLRGRGVCASA